MQASKNWFSSYIMVCQRDIDSSPIQTHSATKHVPSRVSHNLERRSLSRTALGPHMLRQTLLNNLKKLMKTHMLPQLYTNNVWIYDEFWCLVILGTLPPFQCWIKAPLQHLQSLLLSILRHLTSDQTVFRPFSARSIQSLCTWGSITKTKTCSILAVSTTLLPNFLKYIPPA